MLKSERRDQKRDRRLAKQRRVSNRKALFVLQQATARRLGLRLGARADRNRLSHPLNRPSHERGNSGVTGPQTVIPAQAGIQKSLMGSVPAFGNTFGIPAYAGMTVRESGMTVRG